ncbi:helix-turn-helix domain-containing protein [Streptomyces sp. NPDC048442]|uniref:winged helix-turn-helix domain-containing protein n=1 Tax=Streptomyces sp. NPDC048442 TaxID=3154823 RepID=UPI0034428C12
MAPESEHPPEPRRTTDLDALKVFTHPLRIDLYRALFTGGAATASHLADEVDEAVSLVSYHLRKMAAHGFIVEAPGESKDARERWWRVECGHGAGWGKDWGDAAFNREYVPRLTATEFRQLSEEIRELIDSYRERGLAAEAAGDTEGREQVSVQIFGFPFRP